MTFKGEKHGSWPVPVASTPNGMCTPRSPQHLLLWPSDGVVGRGTNGPEADIPPNIKRVDLGRKRNALFRRCYSKAIVLSNLIYPV